jgi:hypothetical protein
MDYPAEGKSVWGLYAFSVKGQSVAAIASI